jgi:outer membrane receptor protein involved in Fe transport
MTQTAYTGFLQDKWHVPDHATFNLGLRYDIDFTPLNEANNPAFPIRTPTRWTRTTSRRASA